MDVICYQISSKVFVNEERIKNIYIFENPPKMWPTTANILSLEGIFRYDCRTFSVCLTMSKISFFVFAILGVLSCINSNGENSVDCDTSMATKENIPKSFVDKHCLTNGTYTFPK